ncbi:MAG TPA: MarR family transcriptional regulator [Acidimicrobiales bacterium]|nr:MarR family transcriptional regulator [Acidimicrobiales bacterium]
MVDRPDERQLAAWRAFLRAHATVVDRLDRELQDEQGLPLTWYEVLLRLNGATDQRLRLSELAAQLVLSRSGLTRLVDRLVAAGLVERAVCPTDRRGAFAVLTPEGRSRLRRAAPGHLRGVERHFTGLLSPVELDAIRTGLEKVAGGERRGGSAAAC